jgi:hypothetical protein
MSNILGEINSKGIQYKGVCLLLHPAATPSHKEPSTNTPATEPLDQTPTQLFSNSPPDFASPPRKRSTLESGEENKSFRNRILSVVSPRRRKKRGDTVLSSPVKKVIRFALSSPRKKLSQRVRQKPVPHRYAAGTETHQFPTGVNARDCMLLTSSEGGVSSRLLALCHTLRGRPLRIEYDEFAMLRLLPQQRLRMVEYLVV